MERLTVNRNLLDDYKLISKLGDGSFADVFQAESRLDGQLYCIKTIYKERITCEELKSLLV
jgi:serine/threonine protein kinase